MKKNTVLAISLVLTLMLSFFGAFDINGVATDVPDPEILFSDEEKNGVTAYWYDEMHLYSEAEAKAAGVPAGFSGDVLALRSTDGSNVGITLDLGAARVADAESITFRIWCSANTKEFRITNNAGYDWIVRVVPEKTGEWIEITVSSDGGNIYGGKTFGNFADENGFFEKVNFGFRFTNNVDTTVYVDSIVYKAKAVDKTPPVISYDGPTEITTTAGKEFVFGGTAYDEHDKANIKPDYVFTAGAVDTEGRLLEGEHGCTVRFIDYRGNCAEIQLKLIVHAADTEAPVLSWAPDEVYAEIGMMPVINVTAVDNYDSEVKVTMTWSKGALERGRLTEGYHTLTIVAVDSTGNETKKDVEFIVIDDHVSLD